MKKILNKLNIFKAKSGSDSIADFFLHASEKEKMDVIKEAARRANEDQREVFKKFSTKSA